MCKLHKKTDPMLPKVVVWRLIFCYAPPYVPHWFPLSDFSSPKANDMKIIQKVEGHKRRSSLIFRLYHVFRSRVIWVLPLSNGHILHFKKMLNLSKIKKNCCKAKLTKIFSDHNYWTNQPYKQTWLIWTITLSHTVP